MIADPRLDGLAYVVLYVLTYALGVALHEGGHLLAARLFGLGPRFFQVGRGPLVLRRRVGRVWVILRAVPVAGRVVCPDWFGRPLARFCFYAAGPAVNLLLLGFAAEEVSADSPFVSEPALVVVVTQLTLAVQTLLPYSSTAKGRVHRSDGLQIFLLLTGRRVDQLAPLHASCVKPLLGPDQALPRPSRHLPEIGLQVGRLDRLSEPWAVRDAQDAMRALLAEPDLPREERAFLLGFLVDNELAFGGTGAGTADLDAWSGEAMELAPAAHHARVLRAGALVALGRPAEAADVLRAVPEAELSPYHLVLRRAFLGRAEAMLGDAEAGRRLMAEARGLPVARVGAFPRVLDRWEAALPPAAPNSGVPRIRLREAPEPAD